MKNLKGTGKYTKKTLKFSDRLRLIEYLRAHKDRLHLERPRYDSVAEAAGKELNLDMTGLIVRSTAKAAGISWYEKATRTNAGRVKSHNGTRNTLNLLKLQVEALRTAINGLCSRFAEPPPVETTTLWPLIVPEPTEKIVGTTV